jgi:hypothetical protein
MSISPSVRLNTVHGKPVVTEFEHSVRAARNGCSLK